jgi:hypothetical protein
MEIMEEPYFPYLFTIQLTFLPYFPYLFTIKLTFLPHFPNLITIELTFIPYFPYHFIKDMENAEEKSVE